MKSFVWLACLALVTGAVTSASNGCFRASILDQVHQLEKDSQPKTIELNLKFFEQSAELAKKNGADIIVFPEDGIFEEKDRKEAIQYGEKLPEVKTQACRETFAKSHPILHRLACIAKKNHIYVGADLIDVQPCLNTSSKVKCRSDQQYAFNTAILIDRDGNFLAKYHKIHLFGELSKDLPPTEDLVVVETEIGRLGLQVCFDILFKTPGHLMASRHMIDTLVFPTWWFDETPFATATQIQMSWSFVHQVNLLAANIHYPQRATKGSGIYSGSRQQFEVVDAIDGSTRLLIATLPINASSNSVCPMNATTLEVANIKPEINPKDTVIYNYMSLNLTNTSIMKLNAEKEHAMNCYDGVCCSLNYQMDKTSLVPEDEFYLLVSNRTNPGSFPFAEEFCAMIHCPKKIDVPTCSLIQSPDPLHSKFTFVELYGQFSTNTTVFPSVIGSQHQVMKTNNLWSYEKVKSDTTKYIVTVGQKQGNQSFPLGTVALYGRSFDRDPPFVQKNTSIFD